MSMLLPLVGHGAARPVLPELDSTDADATAISALAAAVAQDNARIDALFRQSRCTHLYVDAGTNAGVQLRKLYEPDRYPRAKVLPFFREAFGQSERSSFCHVCSIGFEPSPDKRSRLSQLQRFYRAAGAPMMIFHAAASDTDGITMISGADLSAGSTLAGGVAKDADPSRSAQHAVRTQHAVRSIDLSRILLRAHVHLLNVSDGAGRRGRRQPVPPHERRGSYRILMKVDIEGAEFQVLPALMRSLAFCTVGRVFIEWHAQLFDRTRVQAAASALRLPEGLAAGAGALEALVRGEHTVLMQALGNLSHSGCETRLSDLDDETYARDAVPLGGRRALCTDQPSRTQGLNNHGGGGHAPRSPAARKWARSQP